MTQSEISCSLALKNQNLTLSADFKVCKKAKMGSRIQLCERQKKKKGVENGEEMLAFEKAGTTELQHHLAYSTVF